MFPPTIRQPKNRETAMSDLAHCLAILKALEVREVRYHPSGGGDSGTTELESVFYSGGRTGPLPSVTVGITSSGGIVCLDERLECIVADIPDGDWCNNEGGYGHVTLRPQENDTDLQVECDMTYGEESEDRDFEDDEEFLSAEFDEADPGVAGDALTIDHNVLQPAKGDIP
jgi:hypothetical protein